MAVITTVIPPWPGVEDVFDAHARRHLLDRGSSSLRGEFDMYMKENPHLQRMPSPSLVSGPRKLNKRLLLCPS